MTTLLALELVQLSMARSPAPSDEHAAAAAADLMRLSLVQRTQHTQRCQLRAVTWRLQHERAVVADLESQLDNAADNILDLEDEREELIDINSRLRRDLNERVLPRRLTTPTAARGSMLADMDPGTAARIWAQLNQN